MSWADRTRARFSMRGPGTVVAIALIALLVGMTIFSLGWHP